MRIRGANSAAVLSDVSNEILLPVRNGCYPPGAPTNFGAIVRGTNGLLQWNPGNGGRPTSYIVRASFGPNDPNPPVQLPLGSSVLQPRHSAGQLLRARRGGERLRHERAVERDRGHRPGQHARARRRIRRRASGCRSPTCATWCSSTPPRRAHCGYLNPQVACPPRTGSYNPQYELEARKTQRNAYIDYVVSKLRTIDRRFGFNAKPTRAVVPAIIAGDEIAYHYGSDAPEGSPNVYLVDVLGGHCTGISGDPDRHTPDYRVFYDEFGRWTLAGLTP